MTNTMFSFRETLRMYWPHLIAIVLFAAAVWRCVSGGMWEANLRTMCAASLGFVCVVASDEVTQWTGSYGWTYDTYRSYQPAWVRAFGFIVLIGAHCYGFH